MPTLEKSFPPPGLFSAEERDCFYHHADDFTALEPLREKFAVAGRIFDTCLVIMADDRFPGLKDFFIDREILRRFNRSIQDKQEKQILSNALNAMDDIVRGMAELRC